MMAMYWFFRGIEAVFYLAVVIYILRGWKK